MEKFIKEFIEVFEKEVVVKGINEGIFKREPEIVTLRESKLSNEPFYDLVHGKFNYPGIFAVQYYGVFRLSKGVYVRLEEFQRQFPEFFTEIRTVKIPVVFFSSINKKYVKRIAPGLITDFEKFKKELVKIRWK